MRRRSRRQVRRLREPGSPIPERAYSSSAPGMGDSTRCALRAGSRPLSLRASLRRLLRGRRTLRGVAAPRSRRRLCGLATAAVSARTLLRMSSDAASRSSTVRRASFSPLAPARRPLPSSAAIDLASFLRSPRARSTAKKSSLLLLAMSPPFVSGDLPHRGAFDARAEPRRRDTRREEKPARPALGCQRPRCLSMSRTPTLGGHRVRGRGRS